jgi:pantetheine-phosphate adenylyltransferase
MKAAAIYPGSFDPLTNGHLDIIERARQTFDRVIVAISDNIQKDPTFSLQERVALARECVKHLDHVEIDVFSGLLVDYAHARGVKTLLRGLRAVSDFEYEFQLASMNRKLAPDVETIFMMTGEANFYVSSRLVREVAHFGGDVSAMVPSVVCDALIKKFSVKKSK